MELDAPSPTPGGRCRNVPFACRRLFQKMRLCSTLPCGVDYKCRMGVKRAEEAKRKKKLNAGGRVLEDLDRRAPGVHSPSAMDAGIKIQMLPAHCSEHPRCESEPPTSHPAWGRRKRGHHQTTPAVLGRKLLCRGSIMCHRWEDLAVPRRHREERMW